MKIVERLQEQFLGNGYLCATSTRKEFRLFYRYMGEKVLLIHLVEVGDGFAYDENKLSSTIHQAGEVFFQKGYRDIESFTLVVATNLYAAKEMCKNNKAYWIIDAIENRLFIYENQPGDFHGLQTIVKQAFIREDDGWKDKITDFLHNRGTITIALVVINVLIFVIILLFGATSDGNYIMNYGAMSPESLYNGEWYRMLTSVFLHWSVSHLANNMIVLLLLGDMLERYVGKWTFLIIYLMSGLGGNIVSALHKLSLEEIVMSAGASGAIFGVMGGLVCIVILNKGKLENLTTKKIMLFSVLSLYQGFTSQGIDNAAHVGGLMAGVLTAFLCSMLKKLKSERDE